MVEKAAFVLITWGANISLRDSNRKDGWEVGLAPDVEWGAWPRISITEPLMWDLLDGRRLCCGVCRRTVGLAGRTVALKTMRHHCRLIGFSNFHWASLSSSWLWVSLTRLILLAVCCTHLFQKAYWYSIKETGFRVRKEQTQRAMQAARCVTLLKVTHFTSCFSRGEQRATIFESIVLLCCIVLYGRAETEMETSSVSLL